jgi:hypothetical protein
MKDMALSENGRVTEWHVWINAAWHGMGTAWARHGMCELAFSRLLASVCKFFSAANRLSRSTISASNGSPDWSLNKKFKTDRPKPPATETSNCCCLCCTNYVSATNDSPLANFPYTLWTALFWGITQRVVVIHHRRFGTTYRSHFQWSRILNLLYLMMAPI